MFRRPQRQTNPKLSVWSSPAVEDSGWCSTNFMLGVGMVLIQRSTNKIVVVHESSKRYWFLPRGRKDMGETLEAAALREAYEESGYRAEFMPVHNPSRAPAPPGQRNRYEEPNMEPVYMTTMASVDRRAHHTQSPDANLGYQYLISWYIGQIPADAIPERGTGMPDEVNYVSYLLDYDTAMKKLFDSEQDVLRYAWAVYTHTMEAENPSVEEEPAEASERQKENTQGTV